MKYRIKHQKFTIVGVERGTEQDYKLIHGEKRRSSRERKENHRAPRRASSFSSGKTPDHKAPASESESIFHTMAGRKCGVNDVLKHPFAILLP